MCGIEPSRVLAEEEVEAEILKHCSIEEEK
jgi:hypothetical protein